MRCSALEAELRKSKRREEKLQALQFRLREDVQAAGGDPGRFDALRDSRALEYELDRLANRASRDKAVLKEKLAEALAANKALQAQLGAAGRAAGSKAALPAGGAVLAPANKENAGAR